MKSKNSFLNNKIRMKPPLTKFRLGELFGSANNEMVGFIKSLSYNFPDESPWEIQKGRRVPKYITADIGFQVIHSEVPSLSFAPKSAAKPPANTFYGINQDVGTGPSGPEADGGFGSTGIGAIGDAIGGLF